MLRVWTCNTFQGLWPVPTAAVVVAASREAAWNLLDAELRKCHLPGLEDGDRIEEIATEKRGVRVLSTGDY